MSNTPTTTQTKAKEVWKDVVGYEGFYMVSNSGRVKSLNRVSDYNSRPTKGIYIKDRKSNKGYFLIRLNKNGHASAFLLHRLIAIAFIPNPENKRCVNHINGIKDDNRIENLEWCTYSENNKHAYRTGLKKVSKGMLGRKGVLSPYSKPVRQMDLNGNEIAIHCSIKEAEQKTGVNDGNISGCCKKTLRKNKQGNYYFPKKAGGFKWEYANK